MKLVISNGKELIIRDVGNVIFRLTADKVPIGKHGYHIISDNEARKLLRELIDSGLYNGGKIDKNSSNRCRDNRNS